MTIRRDINPEDLTPEDRDIWLMLTAAQPASDVLVSIWEQSAIADEKDFRTMLWIQNQAPFARRQDRRYGRGKRVGRVHPWARIGMSV